MGSTVCSWVSERDLQRLGTSKRRADAGRRPYIRAGSVWLSELGTINRIPLIA